MFAFTEIPECYMPNDDYDPHKDGSSKLPYKRMTFQEWLTHIQINLKPANGLQHDLGQKHPQIFTDNTADTSLWAQASPSTDCSDRAQIELVETIRDRFLTEASANRNFFHRTDMFDNAMVKDVLDTLDNNKESGEKGVVITTQFGRILGVDTTISESYRDILFLSNRKGLHLITVVKKAHKKKTDKKENPIHAIEKYSKNIACELDRRLKRCLHKENLAQFILVRHVLDSRSFRADMLQLPIPVEFELGPEPWKQDALLYSVVLILSTFTSPFRVDIGRDNFNVLTFHDDIGLEYLNVLTEQQFELMWPRQAPQDRKYRLFIHGLSGTGKTMMAVLLAEKLTEDEQIKEDNVLYICHKSHHAEEIQTKDIGKRIRVSTMKTFLMQADEDHLVKHIIVDDGHCYLSDEYHGWYKKLRALVNKNNKLDKQVGKTGYLWVFCDLTQKYEDGSTGMPDYDEQVEYKMIHVLNQFVQNSQEVLQNVSDLRAETLAKTKWECKDWEEYYKENLNEQSADHRYTGKSKDYTVTSVKEMQDTLGKITSKCKPGDVAIATHVQDEMHTIISETAQTETIKVKTADQFSSLKHPIIIWIHQDNINPATHPGKQLKVKTRAKCHLHDIIYHPDDPQQSIKMKVPVSYSDSKEANQMCDTDRAHISHSISHQEINREPELPTEPPPPVSTAHDMNIFHLKEENRKSSSESAYFSDINEVE